MRTTTNPLSGLDQAYAEVETPCGVLLLRAQNGALIEATFRSSDAHCCEQAEASPASLRALDQAKAWLAAYLQRAPLPELPPFSPAGTPFQQRVWSELLHIPFGQTQSYARLTARLGDPKAIRAVASANGANPLAIFIPCHRVIGSDGSLTGYAAGLDRKRWLLQHEGSLPAELF